MCGRFVRSSPIARIASEFNACMASFEMEPGFNIAPTQDVIIISSTGARQLLKCRWGFLPSWSKDPSMGSGLINARAETVATKPAFKSAFRKQRCLVVADGFYEWRKEANRKVPVYIHLKSGRPFGFAGLYNHWTSPGGKTFCTCTIITTSANELLRGIHDRMPAIIPGDREDLWLGPEQENDDVLLDLLKPYPSEEMEMHEVSSKVNYTGYNSPDAIVPAAPR